MVICRPNGKPIDPRDFSKQFASLVKAAGVKTTFHDLRHDHATRLFAAGWHAKDVQERLGHAAITLTMDTYTHQVPARKNAIAAWLQSTLPTAAKL